MPETSSRSTWFQRAWAIPFLWLCHPQYTHILSSRLSMPSPHACHCLRWSSRGPGFSNVLVNCTEAAPLPVAFFELSSATLTPPQSAKPQLLSVTSSNSGASTAIRLHLHPQSPGLLQCQASAAPQTPSCLQNQYHVRGP